MDMSNFVKSFGSLPTSLLQMSRMDSGPRLRSRASFLSSVRCFGVGSGDGLPYDRRPFPLPECPFPPLEGGEPPLPLPSGFRWSRAPCGPAA